MAPNSLRKISPRFALTRAGVAVATAVVFGFVGERLYSPVIAALIGWNLGGLALLVMTWATIFVADARETRALAAIEDPGRRLVYLLVLLSSAMSLFAAVALADDKSSVLTGEGRMLTCLCLATVAISWTITHTSFTLRYAHLYYRDDDEGIGGISFPDTPEATYFDFAYFAFTVGMCFQVSDATISSRQIRKTTLMHAVLSFAYNTAILAFALNLAFGHA